MAPIVDKLQTLWKKIISHVVEKIEEKQDDEPKKATEVREGESSPKAADRTPGDNVPTFTCGDMDDDAEGDLSVKSAVSFAALEEAKDKERLLVGWKKMPRTKSLEEVHSSVKVPTSGSSWMLKLFAFSGIGFMVSVGYMDPGNWATDISGGASYGYTLLCVVLLSNFCAMFLQSLSLKLGVVAERDLAQACQDAYPRYLNYFLWVTAEIAIAACDLAEIIGSATALYLLFGLPLWIGILLTGLDVFVILFFGMSNFRLLEAFVFLLCATIAGCLIYELGIASPDWGKVAKGLIPKTKILTDGEILYNAIGILGATVMPHNLYLHSSIIQTRGYERTDKGKRMAIKYGTWDSSVSLFVAFFVNASILILAAAAFHYGPHANKDVADIMDAYKLLSPALGQEVAKILFGVALLASGQNSTITGTLAGQIVMEGFVHLRMKPWARRMVTRLIAMVPAIIVAVIGGNRGAGKLLILSQVILSLQLPFAITPLVHFTSSRAKMGSFVNGWISSGIAIFLAVLIAGLNMFLVYQVIADNSITD